MKENKWETVQPNNAAKALPSMRAGHTATTYGDSMFIFGGKDQDNNKLNDLWEFNFSTYLWEQIVADGPPPLRRSGHSSCLYKDCMLIFGGIHEVTQELDDLVVFDFKNKRWINLFEV